MGTLFSQSLGAEAGGAVFLAIHNGITHDGIFGVGFQTRNGEGKDSALNFK